jgi:hypothetical protein
MLEMLTYHTGLGVVIAALAGFAFPRVSVVEAEVAGAGAGTLAARRDGGAYDETGEPMTEREAARAESGTRQHHLGRDAAIGAGAAGAAAAEHRHREHVAEEETAAREPVAERGAAGEPVAADTGPATATETTRSGDYSGHTVRRRRGGLLGSLLRR